MLFWLGLLFFFIALLCFYVVHRLQKNIDTTTRKNHIQKGVITYTDLLTPTEPLFSKRHLIAGKPDYIVTTPDAQHIPVEVKSSRTQEPTPSHIFQLAAYCQLLEDLHDAYVPHGVLVYADTQHTIEFDPKLRFQLQQTLNEMRHHIRSQQIPIPQQHNLRCQHCSMQHCCTYHSIPQTSLSVEH